VVIPIHDINPVRRTPWVTYGLIAINVIVLLLTPASRASVGTRPSLAALCGQVAFYDRYAAIPRELISNRPLPLVATGQLGARPDSCVVARPHYRKIPALSVLTSMFLHAGWLHLLGNMLFLAIFGNNLEDRLGKVGYLAFYLLCGYAAAYGFAVLSPHSITPLIGASGAIAGVLGAYLVLLPHARVVTLLFGFLPVPISAMFFLGFWFLFQLWQGGFSITHPDAGGGVAFAAHVGGFAFGALAIRLFQVRPPLVPRR